MATGTVCCWNGQSGWIKQSGVADLPTVQANDIMLMQVDVVSGTVTNGCTVSFDLDTTTEYQRPWLATNVSVS